MIRAAKFIFKAAVVGIWLVLAYALIYRVAEEVSFWNSLGGI